jgi:Transposase IS116/IS110/IS902 family
MTIPGVGVLNATALIAAIGQGESFARRRDLAAWLGLVPRQVTTGGRPRLVGISTRGNKYLRKLLSHGARAAMPILCESRTSLGAWLHGLMARCSGNAAVSRDLPIPASPESNTTWPSPLFARDQRRSSSSSSSSRPTRAVSPAPWSASKRLSTGLARSAAQAFARPAMPLRSFGPRSSSSNRLPSSFRVLSAMTRLGNPLQTCRKVRRLADDRLLLSSARSDQVADDD